MHRVYGCHIASKPLQSDAFFNCWILLKKLKERIGQESTALSFRGCGSRPPSGISNSRSPVTPAWTAAWCWLRWAKSSAICCKWLSAPAQPQCRLSSKPLWNIQGTSNGSLAVGHTGRCQLSGREAEGGVRKFVIVEVPQGAEQALALQKSYGILMGRCELEPKLAQVRHMSYPKLSNHMKTLPNQPISMWDENWIALNCPQISYVLGWSWLRCSSSINYGVCSGKKLIETNR